jgi:hypothetical protein
MPLRRICARHVVMRSSPGLVAESLTALIAGATERSAVRTSDAKSGARFEQLRIDGRPLFLKVLSSADDWIMRVTGNTTNWEFRVWQAGIYAACPPVIDHTILGMALEGSGPSARLSILMTDCAAELVPPGDDPIPLPHHLDFLDHMACLHAHFLGWHDDLGLADLARRFLFFAPENIETELGADEVPVPIAVAHRGWGVLPSRAPRLNELVRAVHADPQALAAALRTTPLTFVPGDWKLGNLGRRSDGRTVLLDWAYPGEAAPCWDLTWYLALNAARLPQSKEESVAHYRTCLERCGVDTTTWWDRQLGLSLLGMAAVFAWEKAVGADDELGWWQQAAIEGARWL